MRMGTETTSAQLYRSGIKILVEHIIADEDGGVWLEGSMDKDQVNLT